MELTVEEWYAPSIDALGTYIDRIPKTEVKCPCGTRQQFSVHIKAQCHQKWFP